MIKMVAALVKSNLVIGRQGMLPWNLPEDRAYFRRLVRKQVVIMGYGTWRSMGGPVVEAAANWVLSAQHGSWMELAGVTTSRRNFFVDVAMLQQWAAEGKLRVFNSWSSLLSNCLASAKDSMDLMVIGGAELYRQMLPYTRRLYLTLIEGSFEGDRFFPEWRQNDDWQLIRRCDRHEQQIGYQRTVWKRTDVT